MFLALPVRHGILAVSLGLSCLSAGTCRSAVAADQTSAAKAISALRAVEPKSGGSAAAREAVEQLATNGSENLLPVLRGFRGCTPLAANWLRNAFSRIADSETQAGRELPRREMLALVKDTSESPTARRLAYETLLQSDAGLKQQLIPEMLLDPSPEFRRDAVAMLLEAAAAATDKSAATMLYQQALQGAVHEDQVKTISKALRDAGQSIDVQKHFGFLAQWQVIGPFDNKDEKGFAIAYPPESELNLKAEYDGQLGKVSWQPVASDDDFGVLDIAKQIKNYKGSLMYAATDYVSRADQTVQLRLGTPNAWKLWVNGQLVFEREEYHRSSQMDQYMVPVQLKAGANTILLKVCQNEMEQDWAQRYQFQIRVSDATGAGVLPVAGTASRTEGVSR